MGMLSPEEVAVYFGVRLPELYRLYEWNDRPAWSPRMVDHLEIHRLAVLYGEAPE